MSTPSASRSAIRPSTWIGVAVAATLATSIAAPVAHAQPQNPLDDPVFRKFFHPVVGSGEVYESIPTDKSEPKHDTQFQIVGKESVGGQTGYWFEMVLDAPELGGRAVGKSLFVPGENQMRRSIMQYPGMEPMEMPVATRNHVIKKESHGAHVVGTETITVPAGTFQCEHWKDNRGSEAWVSSKVSPITVVKTVDKDETMVLVKTLTGVHDEIKGQVVPFDAKKIQEHMRARMMHH